VAARIVVVVVAVPAAAFLPLLRNMLLSFSVAKWWRRKSARKAK
jgi:hypothetical protein